jgi:hypothetical protein
MVNLPTTQADDYDIDDTPAVLAEDSPTATPKHGTSVQAGWGAADALLKPKDSAYPNDFKFSDNAQLVRFLEDEPFSVYYQHWIDREGKKSFVCLGDDAEGCPLCDVLGDKPRGKFAFNVLVVSDETPSVQILTAPPTFARQLRAASDDPKRGPLTKYYWAISRQGSGPQTTYTLDRVRATDLAEEWELDPENIDAIAANVPLHGKDSVYVTPRSELLTIARSLV